MANWNPWHGCHKYSAGCEHCYVYRMDEKHGKDASIVTKTSDFNKPIRKDRQKNYKIPSGSIVYTCFTSDFFVEEADAWRDEAWRMIKQRSDCHFFMITKRIERVMSHVPSDWKEGYDNVTICCTIENQDRANARLPIYQAANIKHKELICEPLLENINIEAWLNESIEQVTAGGESGLEARTCEYEWILHLREQCQKKDISFYFKQTGAHFKKDGHLYFVRRKDQHTQARKANIDIHPAYPKFK